MPGSCFVPAFSFSPQHYLWIIEPTMLATISTRALALGAVLLASALANRLDVARNKGFHPNLAQSLNGRAAAPSEERASQSYRYRNDRTERRSRPTTKLSKAV